MEQEIKGARQGREERAQENRAGAERRQNEIERWKGKAAD